MTFCLSVCLPGCIQHVGEYRWGGRQNGAVRFGRGRVRMAWELVARGLVIAGARPKGEKAGTRGSDGEKGKRERDTRERRKQRASISEESR